MRSEMPRKQLASAAAKGCLRIKENSALSRLRIHVNQRLARLAAICRALWLLVILPGNLRCGKSLADRLICAGNASRKGACTSRVTQLRCGVPEQTGEKLQEAFVMESIFERNANRYLFNIKPYIPGPTTAEIVAAYGIPQDKIIKLSSNENNLGPSPKAVAAVLETAKVLHHYTDTRAVSLRKAIAQYVGLRPENILAGAGSSEIMSFIIRTFSQPGDEVMLADPSFSLYAELALADGRTPVVVTLPPDFILKIEAIERQLTPRTRIIFVTRPNNPTSKLPPLEVLEKLMQLAPNAVIVSDEAYI